MIKMRDLINMKHDGKICVGFSYDVLDTNKLVRDKETVLFSADFVKGISPGEWSMRIVLPRTRDSDSQIYNFGYVMPRDGLPLELIAATGLKYYQLFLKEEVQRKSNFDFTLGDLLRDM